MASEIEIRPLRYNTVAASQTAQILIGDSAAPLSGGGTGAKGDILDHIVIVPGTTSPGAVTLVDGATSIIVFTGGATSVADLKPFTVSVECRSQNTAWKVTTGANVTVVACGRFT